MAGPALVVDTMSVAVPKVAATAAVAVVPKYMAQVLHRHIKVTATLVLEANTTMAAVQDRSNMDKVLAPNLVICVMVMAIAVLANMVVLTPLAMVNMDVVVLHRVVADPHLVNTVTRLRNAALPVAVLIAIDTISMDIIIRVNTATMSMAIKMSKAITNTAVKTRPEVRMITEVRTRIHLDMQVKP